MSAPPANAPMPNPAQLGDFYVTGGTLRPDAPSYVERKADRELCEGLLEGEFCYVLTSRQMGKSSLMVRTVKRLREEGVAVAVLDLTAIGQNLTIEQWYDGLISRLGQQLRLEDELLDFWEAHPELGPLQRWLTALEEVVLKKIHSRVVIFVDEIDIVRSLPFSTDEFFAAIRESFNRRSRDPAFQRLAFGLLGVAAPTDLIRNTRMTPFNIGRRIELHDFTAEEAEPLARGLGPDDFTARALLERILYWTGGHPYLTQRLCRALAETLHPSVPVPAESEPVPLPPLIPTAGNVDELAHRLFLSRRARERDDNLIFVRERILRSEQDVAGLLYLYQRVRANSHVPDDETNPLITVLRLAGLVQGTGGMLRVRNRIYYHVFDPDWIRTNMPEAEVRRQRTARRRGVAIGLSMAVLLLLGYIFVGPMVSRYRQNRRAWQTAQQLDAAYRHFVSYQDDFETTVEIGLGGRMLPSKATGSILFERPNKLDLNIKSDFSTPEIQVRVTSDGLTRAIHTPTAQQFQILEMQKAPGNFDLPMSVARQLGPVRLFPLYRLMLESEGIDRFLKEAYNLQYGGMAELEGKQVRVLTWEHDANRLLTPMWMRGRDWRRPGMGDFFGGKRGPREEPPPTPPATPVIEQRIPVTVWISSDNSIAQIRLDFSNWAPMLVGRVGSLPPTGLIITERHKHVQMSLSNSPPDTFRFKPGAESRPVDEFNLPEPDLSSKAVMNQDVAQLIPHRLEYTPAHLIDLSTYFNAPLGKAWHPGLPNNSLNPLAPGILQLGGVAFDVRGIVQVSGKELRKQTAEYPPQIVGIRIAQTCRDLHFLQGCGWQAPSGTKVGSYRVHYSDGKSVEIPLVYGQDLRDWNADSDPSADLSRATIVWSAINNAQRRVRMFHMAWTNPRPEVEIIALDFQSAMSPAAPFILAITAEP